MAVISIIHLESCLQAIKKNLFSQVYKLVENFKKYLEIKESDMDSPSEAKEAMREIQIVMNDALNSTKKINGFGINDIKFAVINQEQAKHGIQINLEAKGSAVAKNKDHISRMLQKLVVKTREDLWRKKIFLEMMYHQIETSEVENESDNTAIGLKRTLYFTVICAACVFI